VADRDRGRCRGRAGDRAAGVRRADGVDRQRHRRQAVGAEFTVLPKTVTKGVVTFKVTNRGALSHDFKIGGKVTALLKPGKTATLKVILKAGKAAYLCTVPGHAAAGMKGVITVK
jgi:uncharacterized cupredoxin-like copper-binding protein